MTANAVFAEGTPVLRATGAGRRDTEVILSYYQSDLAGQGPYSIADAEEGDETITVQRRPARNSHRQGSEASIYPCPSPSPPPAGADDAASANGGADNAAAARRRRPSNNYAESGAEHRRVAIVPVDEACATGLQLSIDRQSERGHGQCDVDTLVVDAQLAGSALVAPADAVLSAIAFNSPLPDTARPPPSPSSSVRTPTSPTTAAPHSIPRSAPTVAVHRKSSSRDVGIVGTRRDRPQQLETVALLLTDTVAPPDLSPPIFQTPTTRAPLPYTAPASASNTTSDLSSNAAHVHDHRRAMSASVESFHSAATAPALNGHHAPPHSAHPLTASTSRHQLTGSVSDQVPSPITPASASASTPPSSYLHYQPGVHSKAGPLPPPPRAMFDIDFSAPPPPRPPRLRSPSPLTAKKGLAGEATTTPTSVTVRLAAKASVSSIHQIQIDAAVPSLSRGSSSSDGSVYSPDPDLVPPTSPDPANAHHTREGAFPPSTIFVPPVDKPLPETSIRLVGDTASKDRLPDLPPDVLDSVLPLSAQPTGAEPPRAPELRRERSWAGSVQESHESGPASSESSGRAAFEDARSTPGLPRHGLNASIPSIKEVAPDDSPPQAAPRGVLTNLKRYSSLPRTPSVRSATRSTLVSRSPSPEPPPRPRIRARSPDALRFRDVLMKRTALERALGYAQKINELAQYDCGLGDWVVATKERGTSKTRLIPAAAPPAHPSDLPFVPRPRHTSRASISSEATFPLRADAYIATDLSPRDSDTLPSPNVPPPALPYPALAGVVVQPTLLAGSHAHRHSTLIGGSPLAYAAPLALAGAASKTVASGFFASLGRSNSTRKDGGGAGARPPAPHGARLTKQPPAGTGAGASAPNPRPVQITSAPSVPGGPRAFPTRMQRSRTLMLAPAPAPAGGPAPPMRRRSNTLKRPSLFGGRRADAGAGAEDTEFAQQVDKLADLLPHADRGVLAGYLRRAGQDILAIGQYLEDEKNGVVRRE
ncbi:hypothetical protein BC834DRAFT_195885 [Gloeopeniophorella convolvens]|nr:hypothetical protein BC834DRAFT_195885 [Gloeopeniophorella convolvens]